MGLGDIASRLTDRVSDKVYGLFQDRRFDLRFERPLASFTFDDFPRSALENGGAVLERFGWHGTYYTCMGLLGTDGEMGPLATRKDVELCAADGHEVANHTLSHTDCLQSDRRKIVREIEENALALPTSATRNFAYPFGALNIRVIRQCAHHIATGRGIAAGINGMASQIKALKGNAVYTNRGIDHLLDLVEENVAARGWLIFYTHDVSKDPSQFGCTPNTMTRLCQALADTGAEVVTIEEGRKRLSAGGAKG